MAWAVYFTIFQMRVSKKGVQAIGNAGYGTYYRYGPSSVIICKSQKIETKIYILIFGELSFFGGEGTAIKLRHNWGGDVCLSYQRGGF